MTLTMPPVVLLPETPARQALLDLAGKLVHLGPSATARDRWSALADVAGWTPGLNPLTRHEQWDTVLTQTEILSSLDFGGEIADDAVRMAYDIDFPRHRDLDRLRDEAMEDLRKSGSTDK